MKHLLLVIGALGVAVALAVIAPAARSGGAAALRSERLTRATVPAPVDRVAKLDSALVRASRLRIGPVRVTVRAKAGRRGAVEAAVRGSGGHVVRAYRDLVDALVSSARLPRLAATAATRYVAPPARRVELGTPGEGVGATNASAWQAAGIDGKGVTVAVIDGGFQGYQQRQAEGDLPASVDTGGDFCARGEYDGAEAIQHGTAVAGIVHEMAPGARLLLICENDLVALGNAVDYAVSHGASIINYSAGYYNTSRGDGSGGPDTPEGIAASARARGVLWVGAAGNEALQHWSGTFSDPDGNGVLNWNGTDEGNTFHVQPGQEVCAFLKWDDWPASAVDYDLYIYRSSNNTVVAQSTTAQTGTQQPTEQVCYRNRGGPQDLYAAVVRRSGTKQPRLDLYISEIPKLEYDVPSSSMMEPASSPAVLAVGAFCWRSNQIEDFSSEGPTIDGRVKPDLAAPDSVSSATYGQFTSCQTAFAGTSAASPHVAGAAALLKQADPELGPAGLQASLERGAVDSGAPGKDDLYGSGRLWLGAPPTGAPTPPPAPAAAPPPAPAPPPSPAAQPAPQPSPAPAPVCRVPRVVGKTLTAARAALAKAHCAAGKVTKAYSSKVSKNRVVTQAPKAGTSRAAGARVNLTVSRGRRVT